VLKIEEGNYPMDRELMLIPPEIHDTKDDDYYPEHKRPWVSQNVVVKFVMRHREKSYPSFCFVDGSNLVKILLNRQTDWLYWGYEDSYQTSINWTVNLTSSSVFTKGTFSKPEEIPENSIVTPEKELERMMKDFSSFVSLQSIPRLGECEDSDLFSDEDISKIKGVIKSNKKYIARVSKGALLKLPQK